MQRPRIFGQPTTRKRKAAATTMATVALVGGILMSASSAQAYNVCQGDDPPPRCTPHPTPPPSPYYTIDGPALTSRAAMPVNNGSAEHVTTTLKVRRQYLRATGQEVAEWVVSDYHVQNQLALAGWHVTVYDQLYTGSGSWVGNTDAHTLGVTPVWFDPTDAVLDVEYAKPVAVGFGSTLSSFQPVDSFSN